MHISNSSIPILCKCNVCKHIESAVSYSPCPRCEKGVLRKTTICRLTVSNEEFERIRFGIMINSTFLLNTQYWNN